MVPIVSDEVGGPNSEGTVKSGEGLFWVFPTTEGKDITRGERADRESDKVDENELRVKVGRGIVVIIVDVVVGEADEEMKRLFVGWVVLGNDCIVGDIDILGLVVVVESSAPLSGCEGLFKEQLAASVLSGRH